MARRRRGQFPKPKQENGQWKIRYWTDQAQPDGTIRRVRKTKCVGPVSSMTQTQARKEAQRFLQPINDVEGGIEHADKTMNQLMAQWREAVKPNLKRSTRESYEWAFKRIAAAFGPMPVAEIERADVQAFLTAAGKQLSPESVRDLRARLRGILSLAEEWGWVSAGGNAARGRFRLPPRVPVRRKTVLSPGEFWRLVMALKQPFRTIVILAVLAGLRRGELAALRWKDIVPGSVVVDEAVYSGELSSPKSPKSNRKVDIGAFTQKVLEEWRAIAKFTGPDDFVFGIRTNTPIDLHTAVARHLKPAAVRAGVPVVSWHDLRHTYTTWGRRAGIKAETMRDQLGHSSVLMTLDVYSHADDRQGEATQIEEYALSTSGGGLM